MRQVVSDADMDSAPLSGQTSEQCFWDHLGATRAEEYAADDILDLCPDPLPAPPDACVATGPAIPDGPGIAGHDAQASRAGGGAGLYGAHPSASRGPFDEQWQPASPAASRNVRKLVISAQTRRARLSYRLQRIWLTPFYRMAITRGIPVLMLLGALGLALANAENRAQLSAGWETVYSAVVDRPEFMVSTVNVSKVAPELEQSIRARLEADLPQSSFRLDLQDLRAEIEAYDSVAEAALRLRGDGALDVTVKERAPVVVWHSGQERHLLDIDGHRVAVLAPDLRLPNMPLVAGAGAPDHLREALALMDAAFPLGDRLRGLVRVGERRWDVVLDRDQRIRLPEKGAMRALERALALDQAQDLLARDILAVDFRNPDRPILHVSPDAIETRRAIRLNPSETTQ